MRSTAIAAVVLALASLASAEPPADVKTIVDKAIKAHGGADSLTKEKIQTWKAKGVFTGSGMKMDYTIDYLFAVPNRLKFNMEMETAPGQKMKLTVGYDGKNGWEQSGDMLRDMPAEKQKEFEHQCYQMNLGRIVPLLEKEYKLGAIAEITHGNQTLVGLRVQRDGRREVDLFFDKTTGLLTKSVSKVHDEFQNKEVTQEVFYTGYHDKNGRKVFETLTIKRDGEDFIVEKFTDQKTLDKVDDKAFAKPAEKKPA